MKGPILRAYVLNLLPFRISNLHITLDEISGVGLT